MVRPNFDEFDLASADGNRGRVSPRDWYWQHMANDRRNLVTNFPPVRQTNSARQSLFATIRATLTFFFSSQSRKKLGHRLEDYLIDIDLCLAGCLPLALRHAQRMISAFYHMQEIWRFHLCSNPFQEI